MFWSLMGTPAFLRNSCSGCVVANGNDTYHILREVNVAAADNLTGQDIACSCTDDDWWAGYIVMGERHQSTRQSRSQTDPGDLWPHTQHTQQLRLFGLP